MYNQQGNYQFSKHYGGYGDTSEEYLQPNLSLVGVKGHCGTAIDRIQFLFVDINSGQYFQTPAYGGKGGGRFICQAPEGQWFDKVWITTGQYLETIKFMTNRGVETREYGRRDRGDRSGYFDASGKRITGIRVSHGKKVEGLTFAALR